MATRSEDASDQPQQQPIETAKQAGGMDREGEVEVEGKAPVHDASSAGIKAPVVAQAQAQTKAELSKVADTLRDDAKEGTIGDAASATPGLHMHSVYEAIPVCCAHRVARTRHTLRDIVHVQSIDTETRLSCICSTHLLSSS